MKRTCQICGKVTAKGSAWVAHGLTHARAGECVALTSVDHDLNRTTVFYINDDPLIEVNLARGWSRVVAR